MLIKYRPKKLTIFGFWESAALGHFLVSIFFGLVDNKESKNKYSSAAGVWVKISNGKTLEWLTSYMWKLKSAQM